MLDYESTSAILGKPNHADLELGLTTAPVLYAWEEFPEMGELIRRRFKSPGDPEKVKDSIWTIYFFFPTFLSDFPALSGSRTSLQIVRNLTNSKTCTSLR